MPDWTVAVPAWGATSLANLARYALPSIRAAAKYAGIEPRVVVHTDGIPPEGCEARPVPDRGNAYKTFAAAHRDVLFKADEGSYVAFLGADMTVSREFFAACSLRLRRKRLVMACAPRTLSDAAPKAGFSALELRDWTLKNIHPSMRFHYWPAVTSKTPYCLIFRDSGGMTMRAFHLHPAACVVGHRMTFTGTCDEGLPSEFLPGQIHVVTDVAEMFLAESSPEGKLMGWKGPRLDVRHVAKWARQHATERHRDFFFNHPIVLRGTPADNGASVAEYVRQHLELVGWQQRRSPLTTSCDGVRRLSISSPSSSALKPSDDGVTVTT